MANDKRQRRQHQRDDDDDTQQEQQQQPARMTREEWDAMWETPLTPFDAEVLWALLGGHTRGEGQILAALSTPLLHAKTPMPWTRPFVHQVCVGLEGRGLLLLDDQPRPKTWRITEEGRAAYAAAVAATRTEREGTA